MNEPKKLGRPPRQNSTDEATDLVTTDAPQTTGAKIVRKGDMVFRHDLFELEEAIGKKNLTPYAKNVKIEEVPHRHFFHSHDTRRGKKLTQTFEKQGHFHKVDVTYHKDGTISAICGPPLREQVITDENGDVTGVEVVPVKFRDKTKRMDIIDNHTHECVYMGSQEMSINGNKARNNQTAKEIATLLKGDLV